MDIGKSFSFVFEDEEWVAKFLVAIGILLAGAVLFFLIIPPILAAILLSGYGVEITRRVIKGKTPVLPEWTDWGQLFLDGLLVTIIGVVYALPIIILGICLGIPIGIAGEESAVAVAFGLILDCLNFLWAIVMSFLLPAAIAFFVKEGDLAAAFRFGEIWSFVRGNLNTYLVTAIMIWAVGLMAGLGFLVCLIGWLVAIPYAEFVTGYLYGQAFLESSGQKPQVAAEADPA